MSEKAKLHYVYTHAIDESVFYVGMGSGERMGRLEAGFMLLTARLTQNGVG